MKGRVTFSERAVPGCSVYSLPLWDYSVVILLTLVHLFYILGVNNC